MHREALLRRPRPPHFEIVARRKADAGAGYTSARLQTREKAGFEPPVRIESRIQMPTGTGPLPAFWTLGTDLFTKGWPQCGEIDIVEVKGDTPSVAHFHIHSAPALPARLQRGGAVDRTNEPGRWIPHLQDRLDDTRIEFYVDDARRFTVARANMPSEAWAFSKPHYLTLNTTVGNTWTGPPDSTTPWLAVMRVDWVRAWALK